MKKPIRGSAKEAKYLQLKKKRASAIVVAKIEIKWGVDKDDIRWYSINKLKRKEVTK